MYRPEKDIYKIWNGKRFVFTLNKIVAICEGLVEIPWEFKLLADDPIKTLSSHTLTAQQKDGLVVRWIPIFSKKDIPLYTQYAKEGIIIVSHYQLVDEEGYPLPMIKLKSYEDVRRAWCLLGKYMKQICETPTISVTASIGKTTTVLFMESLFSQNNSVFVSGRNRNNSEPIVHQMIQTYGPSYDYHIQEVGGGAPRVVERSAQFLDSDAFCIGNIMPHHLDRYKTIEAIAHDKLSFDRMPKANKFAVINIDDDILRNYNFNSRVVTCGITHKEADYVAENVRQDGIWLRMNIRYKEKNVPIQINIPGEHNAYNAVLAFAMAKEWGLSDEEIQAGFMAYRSQGIRQNLCEVAGRIMYIDCFNISVDSIKSCLRTLDSIEAAPGNRKIAVLGGENALGENAYSVNYEAGLTLGEYKADEFIFVGLPETATPEDYNFCGHARAVYDGAKEVIKDRPVSFFDDLKAAAEKLRNETKPGDIILFKGIFRLPLFSIIDHAFATAFTYKAPYFSSIYCEDKNFTALYFDTFKECGLQKYKHRSHSITIPDEIQSIPVHRIARRVLAERSWLKKVDFGHSVKNIGIQSFYGCTKLKTLHIPKNVLYIEQEAFAYCTDLEEVTLEAVGHIETLAFYSCKNLKTVRISDSCKTIEADVFAECPDVTIIAPENSVAHLYATENNIRWKKA